MIYEFEDNELSITDKSDTKSSKFKTLYWNESANRSDSDIEEDGNSHEDINDKKRNSRKEKSKT